MQSSSQIIATKKPTPSFLQALAVIQFRQSTEGKLLLLLFLLTGLLFPDITQVRLCTLRASKEEDLDSAISFCPF